MTKQAERQRAEAGANLLDQNNPGWADRIDRKLLDINNLRQCVLGQLYQHFNNGITTLFPETGWQGAVECGFDARDGSMEKQKAEGEKLTTIWDKLILERRQIA